MSRYYLRERLFYCWRVLTTQRWLVYLPEQVTAEASTYRLAQQGLTTADATTMRRHLKQLSRDAQAGQRLVDSVYNLNPGIAPAAP